MKELMRKMKILGALVLTLALIPISPRFVQAAGTHTVVFQYGSKTFTEQVVDGCAAQPPTDTYMEGYTFVGWITDFSCVKSDMVILGAYINSDAVTSNVTTTQGSSYTAKVNNNKTAPMPNISGLKTGTPGKYCAVHWYNGWTGQLIRDDLVPYGSTITNIPDPTTGGLEFSGWEGDWTYVTEDRAIKGWYFQTHKVEFVDTLTGSVFNTQNIRNGENAKQPEIPHHNGWHFDYYEGDWENVTSDRKIYIHYEEDWYWADDPWWLFVDIDGDGYYTDDYFWWK